MSKKVLVISAGPRKGGNSEVLAERFLSGAKRAGCVTDMIHLYDKEIKFCKGCLACQKSKKCVIQDECNQILEKIKDADVLAFATPVYFYEMCGQLKTLLDRTNPLFSDAYHFQDIYLITTAADSDARSADGAIKGLEGWISCFDGTRLAGVIKGFGLTEKGDAEKNEDILRAAYEMGENI